MNVYKIYYAADEGEIEEAYITERTEAAARKVFKRVSEGREITDMELYETDTPATKEQERENLEKIKTLVAELGPDSYLKAAFEGVFEVAELNIQDDAAYSLKARLEDTEKQLREMGSVYNAAKTDAAHLQEQLDAAQEQIEALKQRQIPEGLRRDLMELVRNEAKESRSRMAEAADKMVIGADNPECVLFRDSIALYRTEKARAEALEKWAAELNALGGETGKGGAA